MSIACYRYTPENTWSKKNGARKRKRQLCVVCHTVEEKRHLQNPLARPAQAILLDNRKYYHFGVTAVTCCCLSSFVYFVPYFYSMAHKKNGMLPLMQNAVVVGVNPTSGISVSLLSSPLSFISFISSSLLFTVSPYRRQPPNGPFSGAGEQDRHAGRRKRRRAAVRCMRDYSNIHF